MYILNELLFFSPNDFINMTQNIWSNNIWIDTKSRKKGNISFGNRKLIDFSVLCLFLRMNTNALFYSVSMLLCLILLAALVRCSSFSKVIIIFLSPPFLQNIYKSKNQNKTKGRLLEYRRLMQLVLESMNYHVNCTLSWWSDPRSPPFPQSLFSPFFLFLFTVSINRTSILVGSLLLLSSEWDPRTGVSQTQKLRFFCWALKAL